MSNHKATILVVDDDVDILEQTCMILQNAGYKTVEAGGEAEAKELLKTLRPDLAILDLMMENMDSGFILSHLIKKMDPGIPVIIISAVTSQTGLHFDTSSQGEKAWIKADAIMAKGTRPEQLIGEVERLLSKQA
jgi:CheY-like chemotaxis protein